jgi:hypothetical protein
MDVEVHKPHLHCPPPPPPRGATHRKENPSHTASECNPTPPQALATLPNPSSPYTYSLAPLSPFPPPSVCLCLCVCVCVCVCVCARARESTRPLPNANWGSLRAGIPEREGESISGGRIALAKGGGAQGETEADPGRAGAGRTGVGRDPRM